MHIVHLQNIEKNGRIVIGNGGKEIFPLCLLHYNDTCKVNQQFTGGESLKQISREQPRNRGHSKQTTGLAGFEN